MQSSDRDKRVDIELLIEDETDPNDDMVLEPGNDADESDQEELAALTAKHEHLRRQVALLKAQLSEAMEQKEAAPDVGFRKEFDTRAVTIGFLALAAGMLGVFSLRRTTA